LKIQAIQKYQFSRVFSIHHHLEILLAIPGKCHFYVSTPGTFVGFGGLSDGNEATLLDNIFIVYFALAL
jgi:hypothetical protein